MNLDFEVEARDDDVLNRLLAQLNLSDSEDVEMMQLKPVRERKRVHMPSPAVWQKKMRFASPIEIKPVIRRKALVPQSSMSGDGLFMSKPKVEVDVPWVDSPMAKQFRKEHFAEIARQEHERLNPGAREAKLKKAQENLKKLMHGGKICKKCHLYK
jgi:hypothetical protein